MAHPLTVGLPAMFTNAHSDAMQLPIEAGSPVVKSGPGPGRSVEPGSEVLARLQEEAGDDGKEVADAGCRFAKLLPTFFAKLFPTP